MTPDHRRAPPASAFLWLPFGLGLVALLMAWLVGALLGLWQLAMALCIECPRDSAVVAPGLTLMAGTVLAGGGGGGALWLAARAKRHGAQVSDLLVTLAVLLVVAAVVSCALGALALYVGASAHASPA